MTKHFDRVASDEPYKREYPYATLYAIERVGVAGGLKYFGKNDWYQEGGGLPHRQAEQERHLDRHHRNGAERVFRNHLPVARACAGDLQQARLGRRQKSRRRSVEPPAARDRECHALDRALQRARLQLADRRSRRAAARLARCADPLPQRQRPAQDQTTPHKAKLRQFAEEGGIDPLPRRLRQRRFHRQRQEARHRAFPQRTSSASCRPTTRCTTACTPARSGRASRASSASATACAS